MVSLLKLAQVTEEGVRFLSPHDATPMLLTPEHSISLQNTIGSDIIMQLDDVIATTSPDGARMQEAMERSLRWLDRGIAAHSKPESQNLFCIIQGGLDLDLRRRCCEEMVRRDTPGIAIGGLSGGEDKASYCKVYEPLYPIRIQCITRRLIHPFSVSTCTSLLPPNKPRYVMGVGYPEDLLVSIALGADMFDCVWPTRTARFGNAITPTGTLNLRHSSFANDHRPVDPTCACPCCKSDTEGGLGIKRSFIYHTANKETVGAHLLTLHNVHFLLSLMAKARAAIIEGNYPQFLKQWLGHYYAVSESRGKKFPDWVVDALKEVGVNVLVDE